MFDTVVRANVTNELTFNSVAGTLVKSTNDSKFIRFHMNSRLADRFFDTNKPNKADREYIVVLQVMLCGGDNFLVEYIDIKD